MYLTKVYRKKHLLINKIKSTTQKNGKNLKRHFMKDYQMTKKLKSYSNLLVIRNMNILYYPHSLVWLK